jgi:MFS transporter, FHS family, L-fucose permease
MEEQEMAAPISGTTTPTGIGAPVNSKTRTVLLLVFAVFFLLGGVTNINDVLIPKLKGLFQLSHFQANLVQFAFFMSYALFSIPAGIVMGRLGYIRTFVLGFVIVAVAALTFLPAAYSGTYAAFLIALFMIGGGITMLQVAMNPVTLALGPPETASSRLTFAQLFNSIGVFLMIRGGAELLLGKASTVDPATLSGTALQAFRVTETAVISNAYLGLAIAMLTIAGIFWLNRGALDGQQAQGSEVAGTWKLFATNTRVRFGALCIFTYVGAEVAIGSNLIAYLEDRGVMGLSPLEAGRLLAYYWGGAMVGRFLGGFILRLFKPPLVLTSFAGISIALLAISAVSTGALSGYSLILIGLFNSLMFPTIFSLATAGLTSEAPKASGILCTAIVGGALVPPLFGLVADAASIRVALLVPALCYLMIAAYGLYAARRRA